MKVLFLFAVLFCLVQTNSEDVPPGIRNTICLMQCCVSNTEEEEKEKPGKDGRSGI
uniref:Uncharacterized protein n=1 Tax=Aotus nancymaae TaxID=37293 RepID=A0A2K5D016_AOTNA